MTRARVAVHVHSDWSYDGSWTLAAPGGRVRAAAATTRSLMSEHDRRFDEARWQEYQAACAAASTPRDAARPWNRVQRRRQRRPRPCLGRAPVPGRRSPDHPTAGRGRAHGGIAVFAHPARRDACRTIDPACLGRFTGIEIWNRKYDGYAPSRGAAELLTRQPRAVATVGLDFHTAKQFHPLAMAMDLADGPSAAGIVDAIRQRRAQAMAFRVPALTLTRGVAWPAIREVERARREAARRVRRARRFAEARRVGRG